jgi:hypothetical protein
LNGPLETMAFGIVKCGDDKTNRKEESHTFFGSQWWQSWKNAFHQANFTFFKFFEEKLFFR